MKIALLHYAVPPVVGGVENVIGRHARLMADGGHQVRLIAGRGEQFDPRIPLTLLPLADSRHPGILDLKSQLDAGRVPDGFEPLVGEIEAALRQGIGDMDWLVAHNVCSLNKNLALTAALKRISSSGSKPRFILWHHDLAWTTPRYRPQLHDGYPWDLLRQDWPGVVQVVVSEARRRELAGLLGIPHARIRVIPNGIDLESFLKLGDRSLELVRRLDLLSCYPLLLLPVRITPRKNIELALSVLSALIPKLPQAKLVVTGPLGPHNPANLDYLKRLQQIRRELGLEHAAFFLAEMVEQSLPDEAISDFYRLSDLLFFPSREEGFGLPILEAGLNGIPIFCSDLPPLRELGGAQVHYIQPDEEAAQIARRILEELESNPSSRLRTRFRRDFSWEKIYAEQIAPLLEAG